MRLIPHLTSAQKWTLKKLSNILALKLTRHLTFSAFVIIFFILFHTSKDSYQKENIIGFTITWNLTINPTNHVNDNQGEWNVTQTLTGFKVIKMAFLSSLSETRAPQMERKLTLPPKMDVACKWTQTTKANKKKRQTGYKYIVSRCAKIILKQVAAFVLSQSRKSPLTKELDEIFVNVAIFRFS